jgi:hypothetical protein
MRRQLGHATENAFRLSSVSGTTSWTAAVISSADPPKAPKSE